VSIVGENECVERWIDLSSLMFPFFILSFLVLSFFIFVNTMMYVSQYATMFLFLHTINILTPLGLPVGSMQRTKYLLQHDPIWSTSFDFVFFTESDQILISRELQAMYAHLQKYPR